MADSLVNEFKLWLEQSKNTLNKKYGSAESDLRWLLADALGDANWWAKKLEDIELSRVGFQLARSYVNRRIVGEPVAYILGEWEFYGLPVKVGPGVLVPRSETEIIVDLVKEDFDIDKNLSAADFGSGSGCLAMAICHVRPTCKVLAIEQSEDAIQYLQRNCAVFPGVEVRQSSVEDFVTTIEPNSLDFVVANPPYIDVNDANTAEDVRKYEPEQALFSSDSGTASIQSWLRAAGIALRQGGRYYFEIGFEQGRWVREFIDTQKEWSLLKIVNDFSGHPRVVVVQKVKVEDG